MKRTVCTAAAAALAIGLTGCGAEDTATASAPADDGGYTIGMANFTLAAPYFLSMSEAVQAEAEAEGATVVSTDARGDATQMTSDIEDLLAQGVDGIIISGGPLESAPAALNAIKQAGKPVVLVDRKFPGEYTSWIGPDNEAIGVQSGEYIVERLGGQGTVAVIKGGPADNTIGLNRTNGMLSVLEDQPGITVVTAPAFAGWSSDGGLAAMENLLASNDGINAVFCENDAMCLGAQRATSAAGREDIVVVGVDGQKEALKAIMDGPNYAFTSVNDADAIGRAGLDRILEVLDGAEVEKDTVLPSEPVTQENADDLYDPNSIF
ncbi:substrate-binding domain-containing protein [Geodermatophilus sp. DSM 44513]|uniref:substrate-binding domain-containing protein n=1 Tax=Geodermatophilus sp. DSM 44513 TaxID=1528104 RepID=UPI00128019AE|nr:substrate-binding domain-containing protein [Geodermatophilus sp. DSM 44513]WNV75823.1 substrate-binding domain-containing protein [Geodermatophilus sp. DSM 44513]